MIRTLLRAAALRTAALLAGVLAVGSALPQTDAAVRVPERSIKAAYLYKFAGYVEWAPERFPARAAPIEIGVSGDPALAQELASITIGRTIEGRPIAAREIGASDAVEGLEILFVAGPESSALERLLADAAAGSEPILTVTEAAGEPPPGSMINFVVDRERVRFEVDLDAAERDGVKLNSRLLAVARRVYRGQDDR
jgi:hypothetical protein